MLSPMPFSKQFLIHQAPMKVPVQASPPPATVQLAPHPVQAEVPVHMMPVQATMLRSTDVATVNPALLRFQNPRLRPIFPVRGQPRANITLPTLVSPVAEPDDATLFEEPQDGTRRHYLPGYTLGAINGPNGFAKWVALTATDQGVALTVHLKETTDAAVASANTRIEPDTRYFVSATVAGRQVDWDLARAADADGAALKLTLSLTDFADRDQLYQAMTDLGAGARLIIRRSLPLAEPLPANPGLYRVATVSIDSAIPFTFSKELDAAVFAGAGAVPVGPAKAWNIVTVNWNGRAYPYYQSAGQPDAIYFLPDSFKVMRQDKAPHAPALSVSTTGDDEASLIVTLAYLAQPVWDPARVTDAATALATRLSLANTPQLAVFEAADAKLVLNVPRPGGGSGLSEQPDAIVDIVGGVRGAISLPLTDFRQVYDALFEEVSQLLAGEVRVEVQGDLRAVPFIARADDFTGTVLAIDSIVDPKAGTLVATLGNAIESPIRIDALAGGIVKGGAPIPSKLTEVAPALPVTLSPAPADGTTPQTLAVTLATAQSGVLLDAAAQVLGSLFGSGHVDVGGIAANTAGQAVDDVLDNNCAPLLDLKGLHVLPDPAAIWRAILQDQTIGPVTRTITLRVLAVSVQPIAPLGPDSTVAVQAVFESGQTLAFDASQTADGAGFLNQTVRLSIPLDAFVLGDRDTSSYRYHIDRVTPAGTKIGTWTSDNRDTLFVTGI